MASAKKCRRRKKIEKQGTRINEVKALENWERWMEDRKDIQSRLSDKLGVGQRNLLMNVSEFSHRKTLQKQVLERAEKPVKIDKYRGSPDFWSVPEGLRKKVIPRRTTEEPDARIVEETELPMITLSRSKKKFDYKNPEYSGTPRNILKEKGLQQIYTTHSPRKTEDEQWMENSYLNKKAKKLPPQLKRIIYSKPDVENLYIDGRHMRIKEREEKDVESKRSQDSTGRGGGQSEACGNEADDNMNAEKFEYLIINDKVLPLRISEDEDNIKESHMISDLGERIEIAFEGEIKEKIMKTLKIENQSSKNISYGWYRQEDMKPLNPNLNGKKEKSCAEKINDVIEAIRPPFSYSQKFFFDKLKGDLYPTEEVSISILFCSKEDGLFSENWILYTNPPLEGTNTMGEILVSLVGFVPIRAEERITNPTELEIELRCAELMTRRNFMRVIETATNPKAEHGNGPSGPSLLLSNPKSNVQQRDVFKEKEIFRWANPPQYHYNPSIIKNLKCLHQEITKKYSQETSWNLSISHLREVITSMKNGDVKSRYLKIFCNNVDALLEPYMEDIEDEKRYHVVYSLLCRFIDNFESQIKSLRRNYGITPSKSKAEPAIYRSKAASLSMTSTLTSTSKEQEDNGTKVPTTVGFPERSYRQAVHAKIYGLLMRTVDSISICLETTKNKYLVDKQLGRY
ncbi:MYCBP-associated protein-like [Ischnura elegans]|uniref:MYCBP-associated protein-like n=1 Tax=Ischnura elegans TaxID=197161 RepID=UPI001ED8BE4E|nr:MYCBP-associated protein-like [Ischnura elegans]